MNFVDYWDGFVFEDNFIIKLLSERYNIELSDNPDYLLCSVFGTDHLNYDCIKILYTGENQFPDFNLYDYAIGFEYMELGDRYLRFPCGLQSNSIVDSMLAKCQFNNNDLKQKTGFCSFVYSNNNASPERKIFFDLLSSYKQVSSGGRYMNNIGGAVRDKLAFQKQFKFVIAFENCSYPGYTTEKIVQAFAADAIPIYWGDPLVIKDFNPASFINCNDYNSFDDVVKRIIEIDNDDEIYLSIMRESPINPDSKIRNIHKDLADFLFHIFDQPLEQAKRYNRVYWGKRYINQQRERQRAYNHSLRGIAYRIYKRSYSLLMSNKRKSIFLWKIDRFIKKTFSKK